MANRRELLNVPNKAEEHMAQALASAGVVHTKQYAMRYRGKDYFIDIVAEFDGAMVAIEIDGGHHMTPAGQYKDRKKDHAILTSGECCCVLRYSWKQCLATTKETIRTDLKNAIPGTVIVRY
jgi:very-short-patch-repair endonuclease